MIDWHCHVLPKMDDGSQSAEESASLLRMQAAQGVELAVATPHFYANDETVDVFLERRQAALERLKPLLAEDLPAIRLGAEVRYYPSIGRLPDLQKLRIEGSELLLLEMPTSRWTESTLRELVELSGKSGLKIVLAHVERYRHLQKPSDWERLYESGIKMQVNASCFLSPVTRYRALSLLRRGRVQFIGSDCHSVAFRPPQLDKAVRVLQKKLGPAYVEQMKEYGNSLLSK